jgi:signal transduction histidine kinase
MVQDNRNAQPEREKTDESLRTERSKTDQALIESHDIIEKSADQVLRRARGKADAVLLTARDKADEHSAHSPVAPSAHGTVARERAVEDMALQAERASADEIVQNERAEAARILARLLPLEREQTDRTLLTERARSDAALSNRDNFLGIVSHDLRDLLGGIAFSATLLSKRAPDDQEGARIREETRRIERYVARMHGLIGDLLDVVSIDSGMLSVTPVSGDLTVLLAEALEMFQRMAAVKGISLQLEAVQSPLLADFDHDRLLQVLANLISNSIKFTPQGGRIWVSAKRAGDEVRCSVRDTGSGIPEDMLDSVFERFWQVGKNDRRGLGLGLYISKCIVDAHGGRISAKSKLDEGSTFCFILPAPVKNRGQE